MSAQDIIDAEEKERRNKRNRERRKREPQEKRTRRNLLKSRRKDKNQMELDFERVLPFDIDPNTQVFNE